MYADCYIGKETVTQVYFINHSTLSNFVCRKKNSLEFRLIHTDPVSRARVGELQTTHGVIETPVFMPVGTLGTVKAVHQRELLHDVNARIILGNTYHLYLRPGTDVIEKAGGIHKFIGWSRPMLTDSGGYQVYSLSQKRRITAEGVEFYSHIDGSSHFFSPEKAVDIQRLIGADIIMAFDECTPYPCEYQYAKDSLHHTHRWLQRCCARFDATECQYGYKQSLFPIVQGSVYKDLREQSAETIVSMNREGNAIGGLSVGEPDDLMYSMADAVCCILPKDKPRYLMGVGTPANILECIALGIDMFDCVIPTRNARHGLLFTWEGVINIRNEKWKYDYSAIAPDSNLFADREYSKAYLRHLNYSGEILAAQVASLHNLAFYAELMNEARKQITAGTYTEWKNRMTKQLSRKL